MTTERFNSIDGFRGLASLFVLCFHVLAGIYDKYPSLEFFRGTLRIGTDIFFVISGYGVSVTAHKIINQNMPVMGFISTRIKKIYLIYFFSVIFTAIILPTVQPFVSFIKSHDLEFTFFQYSFIDWVKILTLLKIFDSQSWALYKSFLPINGVFWFISVIMQMYLVVALSLKFKQHYYKIVLFITLLSLLCLIPSFKGLVPFGLFLPKWCEFAAGIVLFHAIRKYPTNNTLIYKVSCFVTVVIGYILISVPLPNDAYRFLSAVLVSCFLYDIYPADKVISTTKIFSLFKFLGLFSYSIYLLHVPLWPFVGMFIRNLVPLPEVISGPLILVPSILVCSYFWHLFFVLPGSLTAVIYSHLHPIKTLLTGTAFLTAQKTKVVSCVGGELTGNKESAG